MEPLEGTLALDLPMSRGDIQNIATRIVKHGYDVEVYGQARWAVSQDGSTLHGFQVDLTVIKPKTSKTFDVRFVAVGSGAEVAEFPFISYSEPQKDEWYRQAHKDVTAAITEYVQHMRPNT